MSKYNSKKVVIEWHKFDSKIEWDFYLHLKEQWIYPTIHPRYELQPKFISNGETVRPIYFEWDFEYDNIVVDIKGLPTEWSKLKRKLFMYKYPQKTLKRIVKYWWNRIDYFENEKRKKINKKNKVR